MIRSKEQAIDAQAIAFDEFLETFGREPVARPVFDEQGRLVGVIDELAQWQHQKESKLDPR